MSALRQTPPAGPSPEMETPTEAVMLTSASPARKGDEATLRASRSAMSAISSALTAPSARTANSSPPQRATVSCGGTAARSLRPTCASSTSPAPWPTVAFTAAKWSRSSRMIPAMLGAGDAVPGAGAAGPGASRTRCST